MKIIIEIPEKTNAHIRSDYGHGVKGLRDEDRDILCDAIYRGTPYEDRPHGEWRDFSDDGYVECPFCEHATTCNDDIEELHFCFFCGASMSANDKQVTGKLNSEIEKSNSEIEKPNKLKNFGNW